MSEKIILIGGGGHCKSCIDVIEQEGIYEIVGIVDVKEKVGTKILGYSVMGTDDDLENLSNEYDYFLITLGQIKSADLRIKLFNKIKDLGKDLPVIISPRAYVSKHAEVEEGTIILHDVVVNAEVSIGKNCIINTKSLIEHDTQIGNHCHVSTAAVVNGECKVGNEVFIGSNATVFHSITVADKVTVGAGSVVKDNLITND